MTAKNSTKLTDKQTRFIDTRVSDPTKSLAQCAKDAGYKYTSEPGFAAEGRRLNIDPKIAGEIALRSENADVALIQMQTVSTRGQLIGHLQGIIDDDDSKNSDKLSAIKQLSEIHRLREKPKDEALSELEAMDEAEIASRIKELILGNEQIQEIIKDMITSHRDLAVFFADMILKDEVLVGRLRATIAVEADSLAVAGAGK